MHQINYLFSIETNIFYFILFSCFFCLFIYFLEFKKYKYIDIRSFNKL